MADKFFHEFPTTTTLKDSSILLLDQDNQTTAITLAQLKSFLSQSNQSNQGDAFPTGGIMMFSSSNIPTGWLECDGSVLDINKYVNLHKIIGQTYKTLGTLNTVISFQIPDLRGEFVRGWDHGKGIDKTKGRTLGSLQSENIISHNHSIQQNITNVWSENGDKNLWVDTGGSDFSFSAPNVNTNGGSSGIIISTNAGGDETRPRNVALVYCIKT